MYFSLPHCRQKTVWRSFLFFSAIFAGSNPLPATANIPASERATLDLIYTSTNGQSWTNNSGWNGAPGTECLGGWRGVVCDNSSSGVDSSHVISLNLSDNSLTGTLPSLSGLPMLVNFSVGSNHLTGPVPTLSGLTQLEIFYAYSNDLTDPMPENLLSGLFSLRHFDVDNNQIVGSIPNLTGLFSLQIFDVSYNQLSGPIPALAGLTALRTFVVNNNRLTGPLPAPPSQLVPPTGVATLCPNSLQIYSAYEFEWNAAVRSTPWWSNLFGNCDGVLANGFE